MRRVVEFIFGCRWRGTNFQHFCPFLKKKIRPDRMTSESLFGHFFFGGGLERVWNVPFFLNGLDRVKNSVKTKKKTRYDRHGTGFHGNQCHDPLPFSVAPFSFCCPISFSSFFFCPFFFIVRIQHFVSFCLFFFVCVRAFVSPKGNLESFSEK